MSAARPNPNITSRAAVPSFSYRMSPAPLGHSGGLGKETKNALLLSFLMLSCHLGLKELSVYPLSQKQM